MKPLWRAAARAASGRSAEVSKAQRPGYLSPQQSWAKPSEDREAAHHRRACHKPHGQVCPHVPSWATLVAASLAARRFRLRADRWWSLRSRDWAACPHPPTATELGQPPVRMPQHPLPPQRPMLPSRGMTRQAASAAAAAVGAAKPWDGTSLGTTAKRRSAAMWLGLGGPQSDPNGTMGRQATDGNAAKAHTPLETKERPERAPASGERSSLWRE